MKRIWLLALLCMIPFAALAAASPTTGCEIPQTPFTPVLVTVSQSLGKEKVGNHQLEAPGLGKARAWGLQHADVLYEGLALQKKGKSVSTRFTALVYDDLVKGQAVSMGPVRSVREEQLLLRGEWQGTLAYCGGLDRLSDRAEELKQAEDQGQCLNAHRTEARPYFQRLKHGKAPDNLSLDVTRVYAQLSEECRSVHPGFSFADSFAYEDKPEQKNVFLQWGGKYNSFFTYDKTMGLYTRYVGTKKQNAASTVYLSKQDKEADEKKNLYTLTFANVIVQWTDYPETGGILPTPELVGQGEADYYLQGRHIHGSWYRADPHSPTVYLDDQGRPIQLTRGKTYIAHFPLFGQVDE